MCGIFGIIPLSNQVFDRSKIVSSVYRALDALHHRGPDSQNVWISEHNNAVLGHVRLSIIDLAGGAQPLSSPDNEIHAVVNGEFYDYQDIRNEFSQEGYAFRTQSDSEILLPLYQKYGACALDKLRGEFAFILHDKRNNSVFIARDRFGIKPLYYSVYNDCLYVSSEIKSLFAAGIPVQWDEQAYVNRTFYLSDKTLYKNISQVPPGHFLHMHNGAIKFVKYWDFNYPKQGEQKAHKSEKEVIDSVHSTLVDAVEQRLHADVGIATYLSGGLDSSVVTAMAAKISGKTIDAFSLCFDDEEYSERYYAELVSKHVGANFHPINMSTMDLVDHFESALSHSEIPFFNAHGIAKYVLSKNLSDSGFKVVLTGEGADEIFAGYPHFIRDMVLFNNEYQNADCIEAIKQKIVQYEQLNGTDPMNDVPLIQSVFGVPFSWMSFQNRWINTMANFYSGPLRSSFTNNHPFRQFVIEQDVSHQLKDRDPVHASMYLWAKSFLCNFVLKTLGDRMEMANSIEGRLPFLDHKLVEEVNNIPVNLKLKNGVSKYVLREIGSQYLPDEISGRKKHYFRAPPALLSKESPMYTFIRDHLASKQFESIPFYDAKKVRSSLDTLDDVSTADLQIYDGVFMEMVSMSLLGQQFAVAA